MKPADDGPGDLAVRSDQQGSCIVLTVAGALDMLTAPELASAIEHALAARPAAVIVDLIEVAFLGSAGMDALIRGHNAAQGRCGFAVVADGPVTSRPMRIVGVDQVVDLYPSRAAATEAVGCG